MISGRRKALRPKNKYVVIVVANLQADHKEISVTKLAERV